MKLFSQLNEHEHEMLSIAAEEAAEIIMITMKAMRHGIDSCHPKPGSPPNRIEIATEIGQLIAVKEMLCQLDIIDAEVVERGRREKFDNIGKYLHHVLIDDGRAIVKLT